MALSGMTTVFTEYHDERRINYLMHNFGLDNYNKILDFREEKKEITKRKINHNILKKYLWDIVKSDYKYQAEYSQTECDYGRRYCTPSSQSVAREVRTFLFPDAKDLDIENCWFNILHKVCIDNGIECKNLVKYTSNRDNFIRSVYEDETGDDIPESDYLKIKGTLKQKIINTLTSSKMQNSKSITFKRFDIEMKKIQNALINLKCYSFIQASREKDNYNGSFASHVCQYHENLIIQFAENFMKMNNIDIVGIMFDGLLVKNDFNLLNKLNDYIKNETGYPYKFAIKMHHDIIGNNNFMIPFDSWEYTDLPNEKKEKPDEIIHRAFLEWTESKGIMRLKNTEKILKRMPNNWGQEIYSDSKECINAFIDETPNLRDFWLCKNGTAHRNMLTNFIVSGHPEKMFPCVSKNWRYYSFIDGIYDIVEDKLYHEVNESILCSNRFEKKFVNLESKPDVLLKIFTDQKWENDTMDIYCGLMGRLLYPLNEYDTYGVVTCNVGASSSGKSSVLERMEEIIGDIKALNATSHAFNLEGCDKCRLISIGEAERLPDSLALEDFKKMARGEIINVNAKHKTAIDIKIKAPIIMCAQEVIQYKDSSDALKNRIKYFNHGELIENPDGNVKLEMSTLNSQLLVYFNKMYHKLRNLSTTNLPFVQQLDDWSVSIAEEQNDFLAWLNMINEDLHVQVKYARGEETKYLDLTKAWTCHWKFGLNNTSKAPGIRINQDACLRSLGIIPSKRTYCKSCNKPHSVGCCNEYSRSNKTTLKYYLNCKLIPGGKNKKQNDYLDPE